METAVATDNFAVKFEREYNASKQAIYDAFTKEDILVKWFAPSPDMKTIVHEQELKVGGRYHIEMLEPNGTKHITYGEYVTLDPYDQLVLTWQWETEEFQVDSIVTIDLEEVNGKTRMTLVHDRFESQYIADMHDEGWTGCIARLDQMYG